MLKIICGTDFSDRAREAAEVAALLAARSGGRLELVHALDVRGSVFGAPHVLQTLEAASRERLDAEVERLRALGASVEGAIPDGWPDEALLGEAERHDASLIVLAATGSRDGAGVQIGKTCERALSRTTLPMLVVRDSSPLLAWLRGERTLRIMVAFDFSEHSVAALAFTARFARLGACRIVVAYTDDPKREAGRMGLGATPEEAQERLRDALANRVAALEGELPAEIVVSAHQGDPASRLVHLAERENADLIVTGTHQRGPLARLFTGSVSLQLLRDSATNMIVVPDTEPAVMAALAVPREVRRVLVATDLSEHGNRAVAFALGLVPPNAELSVIHVMSPNQMLNGAYGRPSGRGFAAEHAQERERREQALRALLAATRRPEQALRIEVVEHELTARAIVEQAERRDVELVCLGTIGRSGLSAALLGSTAQDVLKLCRRPLLMVPPAEG